MRLDPWTVFNLPADVRQLVQAFGSPDSESSFLKDIPIGALEQARPAIRLIGQLAGKKTYIMFRGRKNRYHGQATVWRQDANRFAVYFR